tara:strand:- start:41703 stop:43814 length:2112 start_codon:yes stop_codon:yes gene_type:complete
MIIKSISLKDFECYQGGHEKNTIRFSSGINLIIGDNGGGKSKLFDAFYWVLYDQVFNTDERVFVSTRNYKEKLICDNAKKTCLIGESASAEVTLEVEDSRGTLFRITRIYRSKKNDERTWQGEDASRLLIYEYKVTRWQIVSPEAHASILERVLAGHLKPYMWFQGEQVDGLMDFKDKSSLMQAIGLLSNISDYDDIIDIAESGSAKAEKEYLTAVNKLSRNKTESDRLTNEVAKTERKISQLEDERGHNQKEKNVAQLLFDSLINQIEDAERKALLKREKDRLASEIGSDSSALNLKLEGLTKKMFTESWLLKSVQPVFKEFYEKYNNFSQKHLEMLNVNREVVLKLPINVPQPIHVEKMIADEKCFVCGRDAKLGTEEHAHIKNLLERKEVKQEKVFVNDCSEFFGRLYNNSLGFEQLVKNIDRNIAAEFVSLNDLRSLVQEKNEKMKAIDSQFEELIGSDRSEDIVREFKTHQRKIEQFTSLLAADSRQLESLRQNLDGFKSQIEKLADGEVDKKLTVAMNILEKLRKIAIATRGDVFSNLIGKLESSANDIFQQMTSDNNSITGRLKLRMLSEDSCIPEIVDRDGYLMSGSNDSNIILVKLSLIMAVVTSRDTWSTNYCLVSDAPTSKMAKKYSHGFYKALGDNFYQSIVMTYDFLTDEDRRSLESFKIGSVYRIESNYPAGDREDRSDLSIKISEVSL